MIVPDPVSKEGNQLDHKIRILFVIPRLRGQSGTACQSTGMRLVNGLCKTCREYFKIEVLHSPTYESLADKLKSAHESGKPFHVVQYDGHGAYFKPVDLESYGRVIGDTVEAHENGYLLLENSEKPDFIDGSSLGKLLVKNEVAILSLTAAHEAVDSDDENTVKDAFQSVSDRCRSAGLPGMMIIPYFYESDALAAFMGDVYAALAQGETLARAVNSEYRYFSALMMRNEKDGLIPENWQSPSFYELAPLQIAEKVNIESAPIFRISILERGKELHPERMDPRLLKRIPPTGIYGRDELCLVLDQAFDSRRAVLLFGKDGTGKTCAAAEFARWHGNSHLNDDQPILYTSLDNLPNLTAVLEEFGQVFEESLLQRNMVWNELEDFQRIKLIHDVLKNVPFLWILDHFESVSQKPVAAWEKSEQKEFVEFLKSLTGGAARILIISNNSEKGLGEDVIRVKIPPLAPHSLAKLIHWRLKGLSIPGGKELNLLGLIGEENANLKALDILFKHPELAISPASAVSLDGLVASMLSALSPEDQQVILLAALFKSVLNIDVLIEMGNPQRPWCLPEIKGYSWEQIQLALAHAEELSLITHIEGRYYLLDELISDYLGMELQKRVSLDYVYLAFVNALAVLSRDLTQRWENGDKEQIGLLNAEETNLLNALILAHRNNCKESLTGVLMGLRLVYIQSRRYLPWARLLNTIARDYLTISGKLRQDRGNEVILYVEYCVEVNKYRERFIEAAKWQKLRIDWERRLARASLGTESRIVDEEAAHAVLGLALALASSGDLLIQAGNPKAIEDYKAAFRLVKRLEKTVLAAQYAYLIAEGYITISAAQNLKLARQWTKKSLELRDKSDLVGIGKSTALSGKLALEKFAVVRKENKPVKVQLNHLNEALDYFFQALEVLPENAPAELGMVHESIGYTYLQAENALDAAVEHYNQAVNYKKQAGDNYGAAKTNFNLAVALFMLARFEPGRQYAQEALHGFESLGKQAEWDIQKTRSLIVRFSNQLALNDK